MPFYSYSCRACNKTFKSFHSQDEEEKKCIICSSEDIKRSIPTLRTIQTDAPKTSAGARIERFIEESKEVLKEQMKEARKEIK